MLRFETKTCVLVAQSRPNLCEPMDHSLPDSFVHGILQARILEWVAILFSRESSWPRDWTWVFCIAGRFFFYCLNHQGSTAPPPPQCKIKSLKFGKTKQNSVCTFQRVHHWTTREVLICMLFSCQPVSCQRSLSQDLRRVEETTVFHPYFGNHRLPLWLKW